LAKETRVDAIGHDGVTTPNSQGEGGLHLPRFRDRLTSEMEVLWKHPSAKSVLNRHVAVGVRRSEEVIPETGHHQRSPAIEGSCDGSLATMGVNEPVGPAPSPHRPPGEPQGGDDVCEWSSVAADEHDIASKAPAH
jgi:hypothetical protein